MTLPMQLARLQPVEIFIILGVIVFIVILVVDLQKKQLQKRRRLLQRLARMHGGRVVPGSWLRQPSMELEICGRAARWRYFSTGSKNEIRYTQLEVSLPAGEVPELHVYPETTLGRLSKVFGAQDVELGDEFFDSRFLIKADPEQVARQVLQEPVRLALMELYHLKGSKHADLSVSRRRRLLRVRKLGWLDDYDLAERFLQLAQQVVRGVLPACGVPVSESASPEQKSPGRHLCPVCGLAVPEDNFTRCRDCGSWHHPECWQLNDGCGTCNSSGGPMAIV